MHILVNQKSYSIQTGPVGRYCIIPSNASGMIRTLISGWKGSLPVIRPLQLKIEPSIEGDELSFFAPVNSRLSIECDGDTVDPLFLFYVDISNEDALLKTATRVFDAGLHDAGEIRLESGDCVYLREGAVVKGYVIAEDANDVTVAGPGVFDVTGYPLRQLKRRMLMFQSCSGVKLSGFTVVGSEAWNVVPTACKDVLIDGVNIMSKIMSGDGFDICGCEDVTMLNCFARVADDCVALKAVGSYGFDGRKNIRNVTVKKCVFWNDEPGNAIEIGYETCAEEIHDILFEDCDVIHCMYEGWQSGGVLTIHNGDRADVHDITYRNIRVEDARQKLIDFKVLYAQYTKDDIRGKIHDITIEDIQIIGGAFPPSIIRGWEEGPRIIGPVKIKNLSYMGKNATDVLDARIVVEMSEGISVTSE